MNDTDTSPRWPAGHRNAVVISVDVDSDTWLRREYGDHRVGKRAVGQYDLRAGVDRLLRIQADFGIAATWFWVGQVAEEAPELVRRCRNEGHEVACHTWDHAHYDELSADEQRADIARTRQALAAITGTTPVGHKTAGFAPGAETPALLQSLGFLYEMDFQWGDLPEIVRPDPALPPLVHLPPTVLLDDYSLYWDNLLAPDHAFAVWQATVDVLRDEGGLACFTLHPHLMGRPGASRVFARLLEYVVDLGDVWIARADHVASWWRDNAGSMGDEPRRHRERQERHREE